MQNQNDFTIRVMTIDDYDDLYALWLGIGGFGIRSVDDSKEGIARFLKRNPTTSVVAEKDGRIIGSILCGHDGRTGYFYHVCVEKPYRKHGVGKAMASYAANALKAEGINRTALIAFTRNSVGNQFWREIGWSDRQDVNYYTLDMNPENVTVFNPDSQKG